MKKSKPLGACFFASYTVPSVGPGWGAFSCRGTVCRRLLFGRASHMPIPVIILQIPVGDFPDDLAGVARGDGVGGTSFMTTLPAPMTELAPMRTPGPMSTNWGWLARDTAASSSCPTKLSMKESASPTAVENRLCRTMGTARGRSSRRKLVLFAAFPCSILPHPLSTTVYCIGVGGCQHRISQNVDMFYRKSSRGGAGVTSPVVFSNSACPGSRRQNPAGHKAGTSAAFEAASWFRRSGFCMPCLSSPGKSRAAGVGLLLARRGENRGRCRGGGVREQPPLQPGV